MFAALSASVLFLICTRLVVAQSEMVAQSKPSGQRPSVGAIRWDGWGADNRDAKVMGPRQWENRLPFYAKRISDGEVQVRGDSQEVMDQEIEYASAAGLDYWAFCYTHEKSGII